MMNLSKSGKSEVKPARYYIAEAGRNWPFCSYFFSLLILLLCCSEARSQRLFKIAGEINQDSGAMVLVPEGPWDYYPAKIADTAIITQGHFTFEGSIPYPCMVKILEVREGRYLSGNFLIDSGSQTLRCNIDSVRVIPEISNSAMKEAKRTGLLHLESLSRRHSNPKEDYSEFSTGLLDYVRRNPDSYPALWQMATVMNWGYDPKIDSAYACLSAAVQNSLTGRKIGGTLKMIAQMAPGKKFPEIALIDSKFRPTSLSSKFHGKKYLLIDFWYHNCPPCLQTFEFFRAALRGIPDRNYQILCISTDRKADKDLWLSTIKQKGFTWTQYWDVDGMESNKLGITSFPTNFLLDENGTILARDISPEDFVKLL